MEADPELRHAREVCRPAGLGGRAAACKGRRRRGSRWWPPVVRGHCWLAATKNSMTRFYHTGSCTASCSPRVGACHHFSTSDTGGCGNTSCSPTRQLAPPPQADGQVRRSGSTYDCEPLCCQCRHRLCIRSQRRHTPHSAVSEHRNGPLGQLLAECRQRERQRHHTTTASADRHTATYVDTTP